MEGATGQFCHGGHHACIRHRAQRHRARIFLLVAVQLTCPPTFIRFRLESRRCCCAWARGKRWAAQRSPQGGAEQAIAYSVRRQRPPERHSRARSAVARCYNHRPRRRSSLAHGGRRQCPKHQTTQNAWLENPCRNPRPIPRKIV